MSNAASKPTPPHGQNCCSCTRDAGGCAMLDSVPQAWPYAPWAAAGVRFVCVLVLACGPTCSSGAGPGYCGLRQLPQAWCEARPSMLLPRHSEDQRRRAGLYGAVHDSALATLGCNTRRRPRSATTPRWLSCRRTKHAPIIDKCALLVRDSAWFSTPPGGMVICAAACERLAKAPHGTEIAAA